MNVPRFPVVRALGGGAAVGDRIVRLVYMDEAGLSNRSQEPFVVVAAAIVDADTKLNALERHLDSLVERHIPERHRDGFVFHAHELFNGGGKVFKRLKKGEHGPLEFPLERRLAIADDLAAIPKRFRLTLAVGDLERATWNPGPEYGEGLTPQARTISEHMIAFFLCVLEVEHWMREFASNEVCLLIVEDNTQSREAIRGLHNFYQDPDRAGHLRNVEGAHLPLRKIKEDPLFQPKKKSNPLQLADFVAYVCKKVKMGDERYLRFILPMQDHIYEWGATSQEQSPRILA